MVHISRPCIKKHFRSRNVKTHMPSNTEEITERLTEINRSARSKSLEMRETLKRGQQLGIYGHKLAPLASLLQDHHRQQHQKWAKRRHSELISHCLELIPNLHIKEKVHVTDRTVLELIQNQQDTHTNAVSIIASLSRPCLCLRRWLKPGRVVTEDTVPTVCSLFQIHIWQSRAEDTSCIACSLFQILLKCAQFFRYRAPGDPFRSAQERSRRHKIISSYLGVISNARTSPQAMSRAYEFPSQKR